MHNGIALAMPGKMETMADWQSVVSPHNGARCERVSHTDNPSRNRYPQSHTSQRRVNNEEDQDYGRSAYPAAVSNLQQMLNLKPLLGAEIERERQNAKETRRALDEQVQRKRDLQTQKKAQEQTYCQQQEVRA